MIKDTYGSKEEHKLADQRKAALDNALRKIEKNFGKGSIMRMGDAADTKIATISSGSLAIDEALGVGGYPRGRIIEMYGPESSGKTTVALHAVAEVQRRGGRPPTSTPKTPSIPSTLPPWGFKLTTCSCPNQTPVNRGWKLPTP